MITFAPMVDILHSQLPPDLSTDASLPGVRPLKDGRWLRVDEAYAEQTAYRRALLAREGPRVLWQDPAATEAVDELFSAVLALLPDLGFQVGAHITCPDGHVEPRDPDDKLAVLGRILQEDLCLLQKRGTEHVLTAAVLCFPASWTLAEKAGRPLSEIHTPVDSYDAQVAKRVQRLFDGVQAGRPLWRNNMLRYESADLFQPRLENDPARHQPATGQRAYARAERQCIVRLPETGAVLFSIHSYVARVKSEE